MSAIHTEQTCALRAYVWMLVTVVFLGGDLFLGGAPVYGQGALNRFNQSPNHPAGLGTNPNRAPNFRQRVAQDGGPNFGPGDSQPLISDVRISGNESVSDVKVQAFLKSKAGRRFDPEIVQADVHRLTSSGLFRDVRTYRQRTPQGVVLTFEVFERPTIRYIKFIGNKGVTDKALQQQSGIEVGDALVFYNVEEARRKVEEYYRGNGFTKTQVVISEGKNPRDRGVVLLIHEGRKQRISSVSFIGNTIATDARLKTQIKSKPGFLKVLFGGEVDQAKISEDLERVTAYYRSLGYFNARVGRELLYDDDGEWLKLRFVIDEGPRYKIRNLTVQGNEKFSSEALMSQLALTSGDEFNLARMSRDVNTLRDLYGAQGHIFADIKADPRFLEQPGELDLVYNINEGEIFRVGRINVHIQGEYPHTRRNVVLNRLSLRPGDLIDIREVRSSERRLKASQLFSNDPAQGSVPRVVIRPPDVSASETLAGRPRGAVRGQSPDSEEPPRQPSVRQIDLDVYTPPMRRDSAWRP